MADLLILYSVVCYLFMFGTLVNEKFKDYELNEKLGGFISFVFAPILTPIMFGYIFIENNG